MWDTYGSRIGESVTNWGTNAKAANAPPKNDLTYGSLKSGYESPQAKPDPYSYERPNQPQGVPAGAMGGPQAWNGGS